MNRFILILLVGFLVSGSAIAQEIFPGVNYTAVYRNNSGEIISNTNVDVRIQINPEGESLIIWEEEHSTVTDSYGYFQCVIGEGISSGNGIVTEFSSINWGLMTYNINVSIDDGSGFVEFGINNLYSVPYALYAKVAENQLFLNNLGDVDTSDISENSILKWNGLSWVIETINDTVAYAETSLNSIQSIYADTAFYAMNILCETIVDSANFAFIGDSSNYSEFSMNSMISDSALYADTASYAFNTEGVWLKTGNYFPDVQGKLGSLDSNDVVLISNEEERMRIKANGKIGFGIQNPIAGVHIINDDGFIAEGDFGNGIFPIEGAGTRMMWIPQKSAFRVGSVTGNVWDLFNTGNYSFAGGYNTKAKGDYSFSYGQNSYSIGNHAISMGFNANASGNTSVAMGSSPTANGVSSISLGRGTIASDSSSFAIGYHTESYGKAAGAFGFQSLAYGDFSIVFGYRAKADHAGCFVFSDASNYGNTQLYTTTSADNQFLVKASGGSYFYTDSDQLSGAYLAAGSGSWSSLSDKNSKENIEEVDYKEVLKKVEGIDVYTWNYISQDEAIRHIGPYAQDIYSAFNFGETDKAISIVDMDGINLASIKALLNKMEGLENEIIENNEYKVKYFELLKSLENLTDRISFLESSISF